MRCALVLSALFLLGAAAGAACEGLPALPSCEGLPAGGCPVEGGGSCNDTSCTAIYECNADSVWQHVKTCPPRPDAGGAGGGSPDAGPCTPAVVEVDAGPLGQGCPDLEAPDCPIDAVSCQETACVTSGCDTFYVCSETGVWVVAANCDDSGDYVPVP
jgi:hypothetical protein